jgi:hypothetical protein
VALALAAKHSGLVILPILGLLAIKAFSEARTAAQLAPESAEVQAILCQVMIQMSRNEPGEPARRLASSIAGRVFPEYQFLRVPAVRALAPAR